MARLHDALPDHRRRRGLAWKAVSMGAGLGAAAAGRAIVGALWQRLGGPPPPVNAADRRVSWRQAVGWALTAAVGAGLSGVLAQRLAASGWRRVTGVAPPGIRPDS